MSTEIVGVMWHVGCDSDSVRKQNFDF